MEESELVWDVGGEGGSRDLNNSDEISLNMMHSLHLVSHPASDDLINQCLSRNQYAVKCLFITNLNTDID